MIPVKIQCGCGQKYAFDVEPVNGRLASVVVCPACGADGTTAANDVVAQSLAAPPAVAAPPVMRLQPAATPPPITAAPRPAVRAVPSAAPKGAGEYNQGLGIVGALIGAGVGAGAMVGFYVWAGFRFPLLGVGIGALTGLGAKLLAKGTDSTLGVIAGAIALIAVVTTLYLMYGTFPIISIISVAVSVSFAYRISSG
jgi:hypothetical protein